MPPQLDTCQVALARKMNICCQSNRTLEISRVYLKTHDVTGSEGFLR